MKTSQTIKAKKSVVGASYAPSTGSTSLLTDSKERLIPLSQGKFAIVDEADFEWLNQWKWSTNKNCNTYYALRIATIKNKNKTLYMHREIMERYGVFSKCYDHRNHNGIDNRKINIRPATKSQNHHNQKIGMGFTSRYKGVYWHNQNKKWIARITYNKKLMYLGSFKNEIKAALTYDEAAKKYFGEFANPNF